MEPIMAGDARPPIEFRFPTPFLFGALSIDCVVIGGSPWGRDPPPLPRPGASPQLGRTRRLRKSVARLGLGSGEVRFR